MRKVKLRLPDDVHHEIKVLAAERNVRINKLFEERKNTLHVPVSFRRYVHYFEIRFP